MKQILNRIYNGENLSRQDTCEIIQGIVNQQYNNSQIAALLSALKMRKVTVDEILGLRDGILLTGNPVNISQFKPIDIVGTGGDGKNTFNISTCASFVVAGAGYKVAKHGNYAASSVSGASNVIENHGVKFCADNDKLSQAMDKIGIVYLHAALFAKAMKFVAPIRKELGIPTVFNILGPLVNPAKPAYQLLGVATMPQMDLYRDIYEKMGIKYTIVNSNDGYDEISLTSKFTYQNSNGRFEKGPEDFSLPYANPDNICGERESSAMDAVEVFDSVLANTAHSDQKNVVIANAALAINTIENQKSLEECFAIAKESLESGKALQKFKQFVEFFS